MNELLEGVKLELQELLKHMVEKGASDLHLTAGVPPQLRIDGRLKETEFKSLTGEDTRHLAYSILDQQEVESFQRVKSLDKSLSIEGIGRFRISLYLERGNIAAAICLIPSRVPSFAELGLPEIVVDFANRLKGLVLICGATGSGKSTTMAAMIDHISRTRQCHIVSIEDPIEYIHKHNRSVVNQREVGQDVTSFARGVREVLREDPDVVAIGEMRDLETIRTALLLAETGHLVLTTLHASDAPHSITRIIDVFPAEEQQSVRLQLSLTLIGVIVQQLIPGIGSNSRALATEVMISSPAIQNLIRENNLQQIHAVMETGTKLGMCTMNQSLAELLSKGKIGLRVALSNSADPEELRRLAIKKGML